MSTCALVVEGGAMRGIFCAGVLDAFFENQFHPFDLAIGTSSGACTLVSHLGGQHARNLRCYLDQLCRREFLDPWRLLRGGQVLDLDWLWETLMREDPIDIDAIEQSGVELVFATTCAESLRPVYIRATRDNILDALKSSCAVPVLYRRPRTVDGRRLIDGGVAAPIAVEEAYRRGARRILVIRTSPDRRMRRLEIGSRLCAPFAGRLPGAALLATALDSYSRALSFLERPPSDCQLVQVVPAAPLRTRPTTQDRDALAADYVLGRKLGAAAARAWNDGTPVARVSASGFAGPLAAE